MKKLLAVILSLIVTVVVMLLLVPLFYSLDDLRPRIEEAVNRKVRGDVKLGHLSFALFPAIKVGVENVELHEKKGAAAAPFGKITKLEIHMSLLSLLSSPEATFRLRGLDVNIVNSEQNDTLKNFLAEAPSAEELAAEAAKAPPVVDGEPNPLAALQKEMAVVLTDVPGFVRDRILGARFSFEVLDSRANAKLISGVPASTITADVGELNLKVLDIGFNSPIQIDVSTKLNVAMDGIKIDGPLVVDGEVTLTPSTGESSELKFQLRNNLDGVAIAALGLLDKKAGTAMGAEFGGLVKFGKVIDANVDTLSFQFGGIKTTGSLAVKAEKLEDAILDLKIKSDTIDLAGLGTLVPLVRDFKLKGETQFSANVQGTTKSPNLDVKVSLADVSGSTPQLAKPISGLKGNLTVSGNLERPLVSLNGFSLKIGKSDLAMALKSEGLANINAKVSVTSTLLDGDELMGVQPVAASGKGGPKSKGSAAKDDPALDPNASLDEVLEEMAPLVEETLKNPMLDKITLMADLSLANVRFAGAEYTNVAGGAKLVNRQLTFKTGKVGAYSGAVQADLELGLKPAMLEYSLKAKMDKIQMADAIKAHAPLWKDAMTGALVGSMTLSGKGLRKTQLAQHLSGHIEGNMQDGRLQLPVMQLVTMFIEKLPKQAGQKLDDQEFRGDFKTMKFVADIKGRTMKIKELNVIYDPGKARIGDLRFTSTGELDFDQKIRFDAMAYVSPEVIRVAQLKGKSGQVEIPMKLTGTMTEPKPDIAYTMKILTERFATGAAKQELQKLAPKIIDKIKNKAPAPVKKELDKLRKKFKF